VAADRSLVDWALAERIGARFASRSPLAKELPALQREMEASAPLAAAWVAETTGLTPTGPAQIRVVDRPAWVRANIASFRRLLAPLLVRWEERLGSRTGLGMELTSRVAAVELGTLLGWMSGRVLGQYDLLFAESAGPSGLAGGPGDDAGDVVYLVGPNLLGLERRFGFPPHEFRLWVLLHELTHRAQFTGVPWLAGHFAALVERALTMAEPDPRQLAAAARGLMQDRSEARRRLDEGGMLALMASPEQRATLNEIGGMMALLEGHGDVTMDRAGRGRIPSAPRFASVLSARRQSGSPPVRLLRKLIGLEGKLNQYAQGERFIAHVERAAGRHAVDLCWEAPERLPSLDEIREPRQWLERVGLPAVA
jgi:coenzyme F420 biosynthesis associated uncharacterized protein